MRKYKFLEQVARYYADKARQGLNLADCVLVFPNKRSAMFMRKYLRRALYQVSFMPKLVTITSFTQEYCSLQMGRPTELLFLLYNSYVSVMKAKGRGDEIRDFDHFAFWGNVIIDDFNDVDAYLVDPKQLFPNIASEKEIRSTFETQEQLAVARKLGMKEFRTVDEENFWKHTTENDDPESKADKFLALWKVLGDLYTDYNRRLDAKGLAYSGRLTRHACRQICSMGADDFGGKRFGFVGFPVLSTARSAIFRHLKTIGLADFFWDISSPFLTEAGGNAGASIIPLAKEFAMPSDFNLQTIGFDQLPKIEVCPVASNVGQTKLASQILAEWKAADDSAEGGKPLAFDDTWGIVLPNDRLLMPMLTALPANVGAFNVAMQVSFSATPFASLLSSIIDLQHKARVRMGELTYLTADVLEILSQPYINMAAHESTGKLKQHITDNHLFTIEAQWIVANTPDLAFVFAPVSDPKRIADVRLYLSTLFSTLRQKLNICSDSSPVLPYEDAILRSYEAAVAEICDEAEKTGIDMHQHTFFGILRRMLGALTIPFNSNPVEGLQLLGVQETRSLDFDNLVVLSLNERIFPKKTFSPSFIPPVLRVAYQMPTLENEDINSSYQFYRLIARAKRVCLVYDSRNPSVSMGELSRYLRQLRLLHPSALSERKVQIQAEPSMPRNLVVRKTDPGVWEELQAFREGGDKRLSASALKTYLKCPLHFYLENVKGLRIENFDPEYMDAASLGTILHEMGREYYGHYLGKTLTPDFLAAQAEDPQVRKSITALAARIMDHVYYHDKYAGNIDLLPSEGRVLCGLLTTMFMKMLECEGQCFAQSFEFVAGEEKAAPGNAEGTILWRLSEDLTFRFTMSIDRVDFLPESGKLRFIDYKTGRDEFTATNMEQVFKDKDKSAIFQLFTYCLAFNDNKPSRIGKFDTSRATDIQPVVYVFNTMATKGTPLIRVQKNLIEGFSAVEEEFRRKFTELIAEIFNREVEFGPTGNSDNCKYCPYEGMCHLVKKSND